MYKLASGTRSDRKVYDLMGPWFIDGTVWPDLHWDLNVQLTYYPLYAANRLDIAESLKKLLDNNIQVGVTVLVQHAGLFSLQAIFDSVSVPVYSMLCQLP